MKERMICVKKVLVSFLLLLALALIPNAKAQENPVEYKLNEGENAEVSEKSENKNPIQIMANGVTLDGYIKENTAYAPLRGLAQTCLDKAEVLWHSESKTAEVTFDGKAFAVKYGDKYAKVTSDNDPSNITHERFVPISGESEIRNSAMYVPVRLTASAFGFNATWDGEKRLVTLALSETEKQEFYSFTYDEKNLYWLSRIISAESRGEPFEGQVAVGNVILERTESDIFPDSIEGVIFDANPVIQFTPVENLTVYDDPEESCVTAAKLCLEGFSVIDGCLYFQNPDTARNSWVTDNRLLVKRIGNHCFYE